MISDILTAKIILPWNNLGCLALKGRTFYLDIFIRPYFGLYVNTQVPHGQVRRWYKLPTFKLLKQRGRIGEVG